MSGPKSYSVTVFDKSLSKLFNLQCDVQSMIEELSELSIHDEDRGVHIDGNEFVEYEQDVINELMEPFEIRYTGRINQQVYNDIKYRMRQKTERLNEFVKAIRNECESLNQRREDYESYVAYDGYFERSVEAYDAFRGQVLQFMETYLKDQAPEIYRKAKTGLETIQVSQPKAQFQDGFRENRDEAVRNLDEAIRQCQDRINDIRGEISEEALEKLGDIEMPVIRELNEEELKVQDKIQKINHYIAGVEDENRQAKYKTQLDRLIKSKAFADPYFYIELLEEIKKAERSFDIKTGVKEALKAVNDMAAHHSLSEERNRLVQSGLRLMEKDSAASYELEEIQLQVKLLREKDRKAKREEFVKRQEQAYLKDQIVQALRNQNYEVMTDMEVIDFEKETDFMLKVPNQPNYLNLRFNQDGSFLYNFLIPEDKESLSVDQQRQKMNEMESTCSGFKELLGELAGMGLNVDLKKETPVNEKSIIQVPKKYARKVAEIERKMAVREKKTVQQMRRNPE